jgi:hypothetical protein
MSNERVSPKPYIRTGLKADVRYSTNTKNTSYPKIISQPPNIFVGFEYRVVLLIPVLKHNAVSCPETVPRFSFGSHGSVPGNLWQLQEETAILHQVRLPLGERRKDIIC